MDVIEPMEGECLAELLLSTLEAFVRILEDKRGLSEGYLRSARHIIREFCCFCRTEAPSNPWRMRERYLSRRAELHTQRPYSSGYLQGNGKELIRFLNWYKASTVGQRQPGGGLSRELLDAYWSTRKGWMPYQYKILEKHLPLLIEFFHQTHKEGVSLDLEGVIEDYFETRRKALRGAGYGMVMTHRAKIVTHRHLVWLEKQGHLPAGTALAAGALPSDDCDNGAHKILSYVEARLDPTLPDGLRNPFGNYIEHLIKERTLAMKTIRKILNTNLALCRRIQEAGHGSFGPLRIYHIEQTVSSLLSPACEDILNRRRQVQELHSHIRGFLRYLHAKDLLQRDLSKALLSPPCYRATKPPEVLSQQQIKALLDSVDRSRGRGRRTYAILMLMATYGLRLTDLSRLKLDDIHWRAERIAIQQSKTGAALALPLLPQVARALYEYLRHDRDIQVGHREVFLSLKWPFRPLSPNGISQLITEATHAIGLRNTGARRLRESLATHLLRQGTAFATIQDILGHRIPETTQRYAIMDPVLLRRVLEETQR